MIKIISGFLIIVVFRISNNTYLYLKTKKLKVDYINYLATGEPNINAKRADFKFILKHAGVTRMMPILQEQGWGQLLSGNCDISDNLGNRREDIAATTYAAFETSLSTFRNRILSSVNPLFWINYIIFIPRNFLESLGMKENSSFIRIAQALYWIIALVCTIYSDKIIPIVQDFISNLFK